MKTWSLLRAVALPLALALVLALALACSKPKEPQLTPKEASVTAVDAAGFDMRLKLDAFNPNGFEIAVRSVTAHVVVNGTQDLGTITGTQAFTLPANAHTVIDVPLRVKWNSLGGVASLAQAQGPVPYSVDGKATIGGESLNVDVPFKLEGKITPDQLRAAAVKSLQGLGIPGFPTH